MRWAMHIDLKSCIGCNACSMACKQENAGSGTWSFVTGGERVGSQPPDVRAFAVLCMMCWDAPCKQKCDSLGHKAIYQRPDGIVYIDQAKCVGCRQCEQACDYKGVLNFNPTTKKEEKCHFCMHRLDQGLQPACVGTCMGITRDFGDLASLTAKHKGAEGMGGDVSVLYDNLDEEGGYKLTSGYRGCGTCHGV